MDFSAFLSGMREVKKNPALDVTISPMEPNIKEHIRTCHDAPTRALAACVVLQAGLILTKTRLFSKPADYFDLSEMYRMSKVSTATNVLATLSTSNPEIVVVYFRVGVVNSCINVSMREIVSEELISEFGVGEATRWYLYLVNCMTFFNQEKTFFFHIDSSKKLKESMERVENGTHSLPFNEFMYLNLEQFSVEENDHVYASSIVLKPGKGGVKTSNIKYTPDTQIEIPPVDMATVSDKFYDLFAYLLKTQEVIGVDTETTGLDVFTSELVSMGITFDTKIGYYMSFGHARPPSKALHMGEKGVLRHIAGLRKSGYSVQNSGPYLNRFGSNECNLTKDDLNATVGILKQKKPIFHNAKFDYNILLTATGKSIPIFMDTMLAHYVARPGYDDISRDKRGLKHIAVMELGVPPWKVDITKCKYEHKDLVAAYCVRDTCYMMGMAFSMGRDLSKIWKLFYDVEMKFLPVLIHAERTGIGLDVKKLKNIEADLKVKLKGIKDHFSSFFEEGSKFNINSGPMLKDLFFKKWGIIPIRKCRKCGMKHQFEHTRCVNESCEEYDQVDSAPAAYVTPTGDPALDKYALGALAKAGVEEAKQLMEYRAASKLVSSYTNLDTKIHPLTGYLHPSYNQAKTATGRLSSSNPNFQQLPKKAGKYIRGCIIPKPKHCLIAADYAGQEVRILAAYSKDPKLIQAYNPCYKCPYNSDPDWRSQFGKCEKESHEKGSRCNVVDIHSYITKQIHGDAIDVDVSEIKDHPVYDRLRTIAKSVTFALAYGGSAYGIADTNGIPLEEADKILTQYFDTFPGVKQFILDCQKQVDKFGVITDMVNRSRRFKYAGYLDSDKLESYYESYYFSDGLRGLKKDWGRWVRKDRRAATNFPVQSMAASMTKVAAIELDNALRASGVDAQIIQFIHDEILLTCSRSRETIVDVLKMVKESMVDNIRMERFNITHDLGWEWPPYLDMEADISIGDSYGGLMKPAEYLKMLEGQEFEGITTSNDIDLIDLDSDEVI